VKALAGTPASGTTARKDGVLDKVPTYLEKMKGPELRFRNNNAAEVTRIRNNFDRVLPKFTW
jgi:hypothetical protein